MEKNVYIKAFLWSIQYAFECSNSAAIGRGVGGGFAVIIVAILAGISLIFIWLYDKIFDKKTLLRWNCPSCDTSIKWKQKKCHKCDTSLGWPNKKKKP